MSRARFSLAAIAPGILVAATGVGAGDLVTASLAGSKLGVVILWAALVGGILKWFLNEGIARWQMATGATLLEGWSHRLGPWARYTFLIYLLLWTLITAGALISACGVAGIGLSDLFGWAPIGDAAKTAKIYWGVGHAVAGLVLVWIGGFKLFEKLMSICIGVMFISVIVTGLASVTDWAAVGRGLIMPTIPRDADAREAAAWILGVLGGVGGTLTLLSYGYWIREESREGAEGLRACRLDLSIGYVMTSLFGVAMIVIGSRLSLSGKGATVAIELAKQLESVMGPWGRRLFLIGFWGAVFSSLLGVWQSVPYMFADFCRIQSATRRGDATNASMTSGTTPGTESEALSRTRAYRIYLVAMTVLPLPLLGYDLKLVQLSYAVLGAMFMPFLALTLLIMNNRVDWVGAAYRNRAATNLVLVVVVLLFGYIGYGEASERLGFGDAAAASAPNTSG